MRLDLPLEKKERDEFKTLLRRRVEGEPIAYILGYRDFYRHRFEVSRSVLIPRPDTEILVEQALTAARGFNAPRILDIGTGSGCVAISLAAELPEATVEAWDISDEALAVARTNMDAIGVANLTLLPRDALAPDAFRCQQFDVIVSNPPYVARHEVGLMSHETRAYEPEMALFSPDGYGLAFYRCFAERCQEALPPGGKICLEIGLNQAEEVAQLFNAANWRKIEVIKDLAGHDRVICAERA